MQATAGTRCRPAGHDTSDKPAFQPPGSRIRNPNRDRPLPRLPADLGVAIPRPLGGTPASSSLDFVEKPPRASGGMGAGWLAKCGRPKMQRESRAAFQARRQGSSEVFLSLTPYKLLGSPLRSATDSGTAGRPRASPTQHAGEPRSLASCRRGGHGFFDSLARCGRSRAGHVACFGPLASGLTPGSTRRSRALPSR